MVAEGGTVGADALASVPAVRTHGALVRVEPDVFQDLLSRVGPSVVVHAPGRRIHRYAAAHGGFVFWTKTRWEPVLPFGVLVVTSRWLWMPT